MQTPIIYPLAGKVEFASASDNLLLHGNSEMVTSRLNCQDPVKCTAFISSGSEYLSH